MNKRLILNLVGTVVLVDAALMGVALVISFIMGGDDHVAILISMAIAFAAGMLMRLVKPRNESLRSREGFAIVALSWILVSFFGGLPFFFSGYVPNMIDCMFEAVSGFTTTGATILKDVEALPKGLLFWRSFTHWAGGMGVLVLSLAIMPKMGTRSIHLMRAESPGPSTDKLVPRVGKTAKILYKIYIGLSAIMLVTLLSCGMNWYDALVHMFGAAGTGGFSVYNASIAHFDSPVIQYVIAVFCMLFGINFALYYAVIRGNWRSLLKNGELKLYIAIIFASTLLITLNTLPVSSGVGEAIRNAYFQVSSIITTTGYVTVNFDLWPQLSRVILVTLMLIGCCAGSTGGGLKIVRLELLLKSLIRDVRKTVHPKQVNVIKLDGRVVDEDTISGVQGFFFAYIAILVASTLIVSADSFSRSISFETSLTSVIATLSNIGPGLDVVGPIGNFSEFSMLSKVVLILDMLIGRLEIFPLLMLFSPQSWRR